MFWNKKPGKSPSRHRHGSRRAHPGRHAASAGSGSFERFIVEEVELGGDAPAATLAAPAGRRRRARKSRTGLRLSLGLVGLLALLFLASSLARSLWPGAETRAAAVAWEMWSGGDYLVPHVNGVPAPTPPLFAWLLALGWTVLGVNPWWPRLVPALLAAANLALTARLARHLWPQRTQIARYAPFVLLGIPVWALAATAVVPELLGAALVQVFLLGFLRGQRLEDRYGWLLAGLGLGLAVLAGGAGVLIYAAAVAAFGPAWARRAYPTTTRSGYADIGRAAALAAAVVLAWALPAGLQAGAPFAAAALTGTVPAPALSLFATGQPWWWYALLAPAVCLPWSGWPLVWMRLWHIRRAAVDPGLAFCLLWGGPVIVWLSFFDAKQPQFLLPVLPAFALGVAYLLFDDELAGHGEDSIVSGMSFPVIVAGGVLAALPGLPPVAFLPAFLWSLSPFIGIAITGVGIALAWLPQGEIRRRLMNIALAGVLLAGLTIAVVGGQFDRVYRVDRVAQLLGQAEREQRPVAQVGDYDGRYQFLGRLRQPLTVLTGPQVAAWSRRHPDGIVVTYSDGWQPAATGVAPLYEGSDGEQTVRVWAANTLEPAR